MNINNEFYQNAMINARKDNDEWKNAAETCSDNSSSTVLIEKDVIENGIYIAAEDNADGYSEVSVTVPPLVGALQLATPTAIATVANKAKLYVSPRNYLYPGYAAYEASDIARYTIITTSTDILFIPFAGGKSTGCYPNGANNKMHIIFTASSDSVLVRYLATADATQYSTATYYPPVTPNFKSGKTYHMLIHVYFSGGTTMTARIDGLDEYDEPIAFSIKP